MAIDLVTGGNGLLGRALVTSLREAGRVVRVLDLEVHPEPEVQSVVGDVRDAEAVDRAVRGVDTVFHTVAVVSQNPARRALLEDVNVGGTRRLLDAARVAGVPRFVFTSSIDAVFDGTPIVAGDERLPYPTRFLDHYGRTKAEAERLVRAANSSSFATVSLRAAGIYGPHDRHRLPVVLAHARRGGFAVLGDRRARFNHVYVENVAHAHVLAASSLVPGAAHAGGAYFVTDHPPGNFFDFVEPYLRAAGVTGAPRVVPAAVAWGLAHLVEGLYAVAGRWITPDPALTRYAVAATTRDLWFVSDAARRDFGYVPVVSEHDARTRTMAWFAAFVAGR